MLLLSSMGLRPRHELEADAHEAFSRTQLREPGLGNSWLVKEQIRSHTPKYRTERVRFRFRAEGKEQRAEEPTESRTCHLEGPFLQKSWASLEPWKLAGTCNVHPKSKQPYLKCSDIL